MRLTTSSNKKFFRFKAICLAAMLGHSASALAQAVVPTELAEPTLEIARYVIDGDNPLSADETRLLLTPFIGEKRSLRDIEAAANALERAMRERGFAFHRMVVPVQKPTAGEVRLQVIGITLGSVEVTGNDKFTTDNIRRSLTSLKEGEVPEVQTLGRDVTASNTNPAKQVTVTFKESAQPGQVDAVVKVKDSPTLVFFTTLSGNQSLSDNGPSQNTYRISGGVQHANLFDRDHVATVSYTTDPGNPSDVSLFGAFYQIPLYGTGMNVSASYTKSDISSGQVQQGAGVFDISGSGRFTGLRLTRALTRVNALQQTVGIGLDDRFFQNSTTFNGTQIQPDVGSRVVSLQYSIRNELNWGDIAGGLDYAVNVGGGSSNTVASHSANGGSKSWNALRFNLEAVMQSAGWSYTGRIKGQYSGKSLIPGEQFGLGGANTVRGFADRVVSGDYGHQWNLETLGPEIGGWQLRPLLFVEGGQVHLRSANVSESLVSAGVGLRLSYQNLYVALDVAQVIDGLSGSTSGRPARMHLAMSYRF